MDSVLNRMEVGEEKMEYLYSNLSFGAPLQLCNATKSAADTNRNLDGLHDESDLTVNSDAPPPTDIISLLTISKDWPLPEEDTSILLSIPPGISENGPNLSELHLTNEGLLAPDLDIPPTPWFFPVLKTFTVFLEKSPKEIGRNLSKLFRKLKAPQLEYFSFSDDNKHYSFPIVSRIVNKKENIYWKKPLVNFVINHSESLRQLSIVAMESSVRPQFTLGEPSPFPELEELSISFWGYEPWVHLTPKTNFWVALLRSQKFQLRKLKWCVSCTLSWSNIMQPVILNNSAYLESLDMPLPIVAHDTVEGRLKTKKKAPYYIYSIDCSVFSQATKLNSLQLAWRYCFIHNLHCLPVSLQNFSILSMPVQMFELQQLKYLPNIRQLTLIITNHCRNKFDRVSLPLYRKFEYGVNLSVLKNLLNCRSLDKLTTNFLGYMENEDFELYDSIGPRIYGEDISSKRWLRKIGCWFRPSACNRPNGKDELFGAEIREFLSTVNKLFEYDLTDEDENSSRYKIMEYLELSLAT